MKAESIHYLSIGGMSCAGCVKTVETALRGVPGVTDTSVNFAEHVATVNGNVETSRLIQAVIDAGYEAAEIRGTGDEQEEKEAAEFAHYRQLLKKTWVAGVVGVPLFLAGLLGWLPSLSSVAGQAFWIAIGLATLFVLYYSGGHFFNGAWKSFRIHNATWIP